MRELLREMPSFAELTLPITAKEKEKKMDKIKFLTPIDGTMVCDKAGIIDNDALLIDITLKASAGRRITVNGLETTDNGGFYTVKMPLTAYQNKLVARDTETGDTAEATIYRLKNASMKYRLSLDDNIECFKEIAENNYKSIFDQPYLRLMKDLNVKYGTKVHANIYYCCSEFSTESSPKGSFNLSQFPDKYKGEFEEASEWLRLSFHAFKNLPDEPYAREDGRVYMNAYEECAMVNEEIIRFAGEKSLSDYTTIHWCRGTKEACKAFRANGYKYLQGGTPINYYLTDEQFLEAVRKYGNYYDPETDLVFTTNSCMLNAAEVGPTEIPKRLDERSKQYPLNGFIDLIIHEQYFYPHFHLHRPDYRERIEAGIRWCHEHGYEPSFRSEPLKPW